MVKWVLLLFNTYQRRSSRSLKGHTQERKLRTICLMRRKTKKMRRFRPQNFGLDTRTYFLPTGWRRIVQTTQTPRAELGSVLLTTGRRNPGFWLVRISSKVISCRPYTDPNKSDAAWQATRLWMDTKELVLCGRKICPIEW